jgi:hypothetical protein
MSFKRRGEAGTRDAWLKLDSLIADIVMKRLFFSRVRLVDKARSNYIKSRQDTRHWQAALLICPMIVTKNKKL